MTTMRSRRVSTLLLPGILLLGALTLSGCSIVGNFLPGGGGGTVIPGQNIPSDFPSDVPLVDGDVQLGLTIPGDNGEKAWNVTIQTTGDDPFEAAKGKLTDAGFELKDLPSATGAEQAAFQKDPYSVVLVVASTDGGWTVNYTVTNADTGQ